MFGCPKKPNSYYLIEDDTYLIEDDAYLIEDDAHLIEDDAYLIEDGAYLIKDGTSIISIFFLIKKQLAYEKQEFTQNRTPQYFIGF